MDLRIPPPGYAFIPRQNTASTGRRVGSRWDKRPKGTLASSSDVRARLGWRREDTEGQRREESISSSNNNNNINNNGNVNNRNIKNGNIRRQLGGRCSRCFGEHSASECTCHPEELRCRYPPCARKVGHELTKSYNLPVCWGALGHRSFCHDTVGEDGQTYGYSEEAARRLRDDFYRFQHLLTDEDWQELAEQHSAEGVRPPCSNAGRKRWTERPGGTRPTKGRRKAVAWREGVDRSGGDWVEDGLVLTDVKTFLVAGREWWWGGDMTVTR